LHNESAKTPRERTLEVALRTPSGLLAFGFGSGLSPKAPGTIGSVAALLPFLLLAQLEPWFYLAVTTIAFAVGVWVCGRASSRLGVHDHGGIVWDEFVGLWLTLFLCPLNIWSIGLGFILFRAFDILKPWPIGWLDRHTKGGFGIMIDDVAAAVYAWVTLQLLLRF